MDNRNNSVVYPGFKEKTWEHASFRPKSWFSQPYFRLDPWIDAQLISRLPTTVQEENWIRVSGGKSSLTLRTQGTALVYINIWERLQIPDVTQTQENANIEEEKEEKRIYRKMASSKKKKQKKNTQFQTWVYNLTLFQIKVVQIYGLFWIKKGPKTIPFGATHSYIACIGEYPTPFSCANTEDVRTIINDKLDKTEFFSNRKTLQFWGGRLWLFNH